MPHYQTTQFIPVDIKTCWEFFSNPLNLSLITPPDMNFRIFFPDPMPTMYAGQLIRYRVSPLLGIPVEWITEITQVREFEYFIDNQAKGPFRLWHHQHFFTTVPGGVLMTDVVNYELPFGKAGSWLGGWMVQKRVKAIFDFRKAFIEKRFGAGTPPSV